MHPIFSLICTNTCAVAVLPSILDQCDLEAIQASGQFFIFMKCDWVPTDITDPAEWAAAVISGDVVITPCGFFGKPLPSQTNHDVTCGRKYQVQEGQQYVFLSNLVERITLEEQEFYKILRANARKYHVIPVLCDELGAQFILDAEYIENITVPGRTPGRPFTWIVPPDWVVESGENNLFNWNFTLQIPNPGIDCRRRLAGVSNALKEQ